MKINNPKTGEYIENSLCDGHCMCHSIHMIFGNDPDTCAECGCPKTLKGFEKFKEKNKND